MDRRFAFYELARYFLESYNPKCYKEVVILNCILDYDGPLPEDTPMRYFAHNFVTVAKAVIEYKGTTLSAFHEAEAVCYEWINQWVKENT